VNGRGVTVGGRPSNRRLLLARQMGRSGEGAKLVQQKHRASDSLFSRSRAGIPSLTNCRRGLPSLRSVVG
jgi:hypothetical protein